jgi:oxygen-dependent protoporphyrinogen oxidase
MSTKLILGSVLDKLLPKKKQKSNSITSKGKTKHGLISPQGGMQSLVDQLTAYLRSKGVVFHFSQQYPVLTSELLTIPHVIATSPLGAAELLKNMATSTSRLLNQVEMLPVVSATLFFKRSEGDLPGFGCLFPITEKIRALGVLFTSSMFREKSPNRAETWILGGFQSDFDMNRSDQQMAEGIVQIRKKIFPKSTGSMLGYHIQKWPNGIPHYTVELEKIVSQLVVPQNVFLMGNYLGGIGLSKILEKSKALPFEISQFSESSF